MYPNFIGPWHFASKCATLHTKTKTRNGVTRVRNGLMSTIQEMSMTIKKVVTSELVVIAMIKMTFTDDNFIFFEVFQIVSYTCHIRKIIKIKTEQSHTNVNKE